MTRTRRPRPAPRRARIRRRRVACLLLVVAAVAAVLAGLLVGSSSSTTAPPAERATGRRPDPGAERHARALGVADGAVPPGTTVFDDVVPGVGNLDPALLAALRDAATDAARAGLRLVVDSGWRSAAYQAHLLREAVSQYGSEAEAARWVARPDTSSHVSGDAVDLGPPAGAAWLAEHGARYGLCPVYGNEPWHFELRPEAVAHGCPAVYADPTYDPRMRRVAAATARAELRDGVAEPGRQRVGEPRVPLALAHPGDVAVGPDQDGRRRRDDAEDRQLPRPGSVGVDVPHAVAPR